MRIERIYTRNVVGTSRSSSLASAAEIMRKFHVGALLVTDDPPEEANAVGILTDRDMVVQAVADGLDTRALKVGDVMTPGINYIPEKADLHEALEIMRTRGVRRLVVTRDGGQVAGVLSMDDVIDGLAADMASLAQIVKTETQSEREAVEGGTQY
ncbi:MAG TPA: CBS domain-containing protein [Usitatibacter sp.]|nr:CBS domain-containing protein [Usitatibacter sp.]